MGKNKRPQMQRPKTHCVCGCGRKLTPDTGRNFATPACVLRTMQKHPGLVEIFGGNLQEAINLTEEPPETE
jgi:hypothetical protein